MSKSIFDCSHSGQQRLWIRAYTETVGEAVEGRLNRRRIQHVDVGLIVQPDVAELLGVIFRHLVRVAGYLGSKVQDDPVHWRSFGLAVILCQPLVQTSLPTDRLDEPARGACTVLAARQSRHQRAHHCILPRGQGCRLGTLQEF